MNSRTLYRCIATALGVISAMGGMVVADELVPISTKLDSAYVSKYVWRGIQQTTDGAYQPAITFSGGNGLSYNAWASVNLSGNSVNTGKLNEVDHTLNYAYTANKYGMNSGLIYYVFPNTTYPSTAEVYTSVSLGGLLSPTVAVNYDFGKANGAYFSLSGGYNYNLPWAMKSATTLALSAKVGYATAGYNDFWFYGTNKSAFTDLLLTASVPFTVGKGISIVPSVNYASVIDTQLRDAVSTNGLDADNFYGSLAMSYSF